MKHFRKTIALFLVVVMLTITMGSTVLAGNEKSGILGSRQKRPWIAGFWMELIQLVTIT